MNSGMVPVSGDSKMNNFKREAIKTTAEFVAAELGCSLLDAVTKMQGTAARDGNEAMLDDLIEFKRELIGL